MNRYETLFLFCFYLNAFEQCWKLQCLFSESFREQCSTEVSKDPLSKFKMKCILTYVDVRRLALKYEVHIHISHQLFAKMAPCIPCKFAAPVAFLWRKDLVNRNYRYMKRFYRSALFTLDSSLNIKSAAPS